MKTILVFFFSIILFTSYSQCDVDAGSDTTICPGGTANISTDASGDGNLTYSWLPSLGLSCDDCPNPNANPASTTTYTVTLTDEDGCTSSDQITVNVANLPNPAFNFLPNSSCANTPVQFSPVDLTPGLSYDWNFGNPASGGANNNSTIQNPSHLFVATGNGNQNFTVTLTVTNGFGCESTTTNVVSVGQLPDATLIDPIANFRNCDGTNFTMEVFNGSTTTNTNYQIIWGDGTPDFNSATFSGSITHTYTTADIFDLQFIVTGANGCVDIMEQTVSNITNPAIGAANPGATTGCGPLTLCFPLSNYLTNHPSTIYIVDYGDNSPIDTLPHPPPATICHTYTESSCGQAGNAFTFSIQAENLCDNSLATISPIRVYTGPEAEFNASPIPGCVNTPITFFNTSTLGFNSTCATTTIFNWDFGDGTTLTQFSLSNPTHAYANPGTYTVTLSAQNACTTTVYDQEICIEAAPVPLFTIAPETACIPVNSSITNSSDTLNTCDINYSWSVIFNGSTCLPSAGTWNYANGTDQNSWEPEFEFLSTGMYIVRLTITNSCGSFFYQDTVIAQGPPQLSIPVLGPICAGESIAPIPTINDCYELTDSYTWDFTGGNPSSSSNQVPGSINYPNAGVFDVTLEIENQCGTVQVTRPLTVNSPPIANAGNDVAFCSGQNAVIGSVPVGGVSYSWNPALNLSNAFSSNPTVNGTNVTPDPILQQYVLTASTSATCLSTDTVIVTVNPIPVLAVNNPTICAGETADLLVSGAGIGGTYTWNPDADLSCEDCEDPTVTTLATSTYTVVGENSHGCSSSINSTVTVNPLPIVNAGADQLLCDQPITVTLVGNPIGGVWSGSPNVTAGGDFTPNGSEISNLVYEYIHPITGCENSDTILVTVSSAVIPTISALDSVCINSGIVDLSTLLNADPLGGTFSGNGVSGINFNPATAGVGTHEIIYFYGASTCQSSDTAQIIVNAVSVLATANAAICINDTVALSVTGAGVGGSYSWTPNTTLSCDDCDSPNAWPLITTTYTIQGTNSFGCSSSTTSTVTVNPLPVVNAGADQILCDQPIPVNLTGSPLGGTWSGSPNLTVGGTFTPNSAENVNVIYEYTHPITSCVNSDTINILVSPPVVPTMTNGQEICFEETPVDLNVYLSPNPLGGTWSGNGVSGNTFSPSIAGVGPHMLSYTFGVGTCQTVTDVEVTVLPQPTILSSNEVICVGQTVTLNASGAGAGGSYSWTPNTSLSCDDCDSPDASPVLTTIYTITGTNSFGCSNTTTSTVTVNVLPVANAGNDTTLCNLPSSVQFIGTQSGGTWSGPIILPDGTFTPNGVGSFTVTYSVTLGTGCENSDDKIITIIDPAQADAGPDLEACILNATQQLNGLPAGGTWTGTNVSSSGVFSLSQDGTFELVYSYGAGNCLTRDTMEFVVHPLPIVDAGLNEELCISESDLTLSGTPIGGTWSGVGIVDATNGIFDPMVAGAGSHTITYTYTNPITTCVNSDQLDVVVRPLPVVNFTVDPIVCMGADVLFTNTSTLVDQSNWGFGDGAFSSDLNPTHVYTSIGFFDVQLIVTTEFGCQDSITQTIEVREPPVANFTVAPDSLCGPLVASFTNLSSGVDITYSWNFGNGTTSILQNPADVSYNASIVSDTTYYITLDVTNYCGTVSHEDSVIVMPQPFAIFGTDFSSGCSPFTANFASTSVGLPDTYSWDFGDGFTASTTDSLFSHVFTTGATQTDYEIMLIVSNECGVDTTYQTVTVLPNSVNAFFNTSTTTSCNDLTVTFTQYTLGGTNYSWDFGDGVTSSEYSPTHVYSSPGTYTVSLFANDGCSFDTTSVDIEVLAPPLVGFSVTPDSVCVNVPFSFVNESENGVASFWDFGDGTTSGVTSPTHSYAVSGSYTVTLTGTSLIDGCTSTVTQTVNVSVNPTASFSATPTNGCVPLTVQFTNQSSNASFYSWDFGDGNTSTQVNPTHTFTQDGVFTVQLIVENLNGCTDTVEQNFTVYPLPVAEFTYNSTNTCYTPTTVNFVNQSTGAVNYAWDFGDGTQSVLTNPIVVYDLPGTYTISLEVTNQYGCLDVYEQQITIYPTPEAAFVLPTSIACENQELLFQSASNFADSIVWSFGDGTVLTGESVTYNYPFSGTYFVTIMAYGVGGCGDTLTIATPITVNPSPTADFSYVNVQIPDPLSGTVEFTNLSSGATDYEWEFGNGEFSTDEHPIHRYNSYGDFEVLLIAINEFGCRDSLYENIRVTFFNGLFLPNAMYPEHSDYEISHFVPKGVGMKEFSIQIYDDWGNMIWQSTALDSDGRPTEAWDGTYKGEPVQQDAYVWKVTARFLDESVWEGKEYEDGVYKRAGTVTVIR